MARSTRRDDRPGPESEGGRVVLALVLGLALLAGAAYSAAYFLASGRVPVGTTVAGVDVGGHNRSGAEQVLRDSLSTRADTPFTVRIGGQVRQVQPSQVGLGVDYAASVGKADVEHGWHPSHLWAYFTGGETFGPVVTLDQDRLGRLIRRLDATDGRRPRDGRVVFGRHAFRIRSPRPGLSLDPRVAGMAFWNAYLSDHPSVDLRMSSVAPAIDTASLNRFVKHFANPAMASSVELHFGRASVHLAPSSYGDLLSARPVGNRLLPSVRASALARITDAQLTGAAIDRPRPATVALVAGRPQVVPARPGVTFTPRDVASALMRAIASPSRSARVRPTRAAATFTDADARHLGIRTQIATFTALLPRGSHRTVVAAARTLDGTVLKPGQSLSLRGVLGSTTPTGANGDALATGLFNAAWLGGLRVTAHASAATYTHAAPVGRDASVRGGQDLAFTDNTRYGVLVQVASHHRHLTVTLWSTPGWQVSSTHSKRSAVVPAGRHFSHAADCTARQGSDGFRVTVTRTLTGHGTRRTSSYTVTYTARPSVVCRGHHHGGGH